MAGICTVMVQMPHAKPQIVMEFRVKAAVPVFSREETAAGAGATTGHLTAVIRRINLKLFNVVFVLSVFAACFLSATCSSVKRVGNDFTDTCTHCHGAQLEGVRNYTEKCGECHELNTLPPEKVTVSQRCEALLCEPHTHKIKNVFQPTPSCFSCHRKTDF